MSRAHVALALALVLGACDPGPPPTADAGSDAAITSDAGPLPSDAGHDTGPPDTNPPDAWSRVDAGPDLGPLGCAMPGMAVPVTMPPVGVAWTATLDASMRVDHHVVACAPDATAPDVVLALDVPAAGHLVIETTDPALDTVIGVRTSCDDPTSEIACNDDGDRFGGSSRVTLDVTAGAHLFVIVDTRMAGASIPVRATLLPLRAMGEACDLAGALDACAAGTFCADMGGSGQCRIASEGGCPPSGAFVDLASHLVGRRARYVGTLAGHADTAAPHTCPGLVAMSRPDAVHRLVMPFRGRVDAVAFGVISPLLFVRTACTDGTSERACDALGGIDARALGVIDAGTELFFFVEPIYGTPGEYTLVVDLDRVVGTGEPCATVGIDLDVCDPAQVCRDEGGPSRICRDVACGDGYVEGSEQCDRPLGVARDGCDDTCHHDDACASPIDFALVATPTGTSLVARGSNVGSLDRTKASCTPASAVGGGDVVFEYVAPAAGTLRASTVGSAFDTVLYVRDACTSTDRACNDDRGGGVLQSEITTPVTAGQHVLLVVDGYGTMSRGAYVLTVTLE